MHLTTQALVLREVHYKESDKILTLLTKEMGKITASARGCRKKTCLISAGCQQLVWSEFVLYEYKGRWTVKEVAVEEEFKGLVDDFLRFSLACYFAEVSEILAIEELPQQDLLSLLLNSLYVLEKRRDLPLEMVKLVFELRAICQSGYQPMLDCCSFCEAHQPVQPQLSLEHGTIHCYHCGGKGFPLSTPTLSALHYVLDATPKEIFNFSMENYRAVGELSEKYLLMQLDRPFKTLDFYKKMNAT